MLVQELSPNQTTPSAEVVPEVLDVPEPPDAIERLPDDITLHRLSHEYWERVVILHGAKLTDRQRRTRWFTDKKPSNSMSDAEKYALRGKSTMGIVAVDATNDPIGYASVSMGPPLSSGELVGEFAAVVPDANAGKGVCTALAVCAGRWLNASNVPFMSAEVLIENTAMRRTFFNLPKKGRLPGANVAKEYDDGVVSFAVDLRGMPDYELGENNMPRLVPDLSKNDAELVQ